MNRSLDSNAITKCCYTFVLITFALSFLFGFANAQKYAVLSNIFFIVMFVLILVATSFNMFCNHGAKHIDGQLFAILFLLTSFWDTHFIFSWNDELNIPVAVIGVLCLNISLILIFYKIFVKNKQLSSFRFSAFFHKYSGLLIILVIFSILSIQDFGLWFRGDSYFYYESIVNSRNAWDFTLNDLSPFMMGGHTAYAYAFFLSIGEYLWHNAGNGIRLVNLVMSLATISMFYGITSTLFKKLEKIGNTLLTAVFAFAPLFFGISYLISSDFPLLCFFTIFLFAHIKRLEIVQWISILAICFSKEIGIVVLAGFYLGETIYYVKQNYKNSKQFRLFSVLFSGKRVIDYSACFLFLIPVLFLDEGWMQELKLNLLNSDQATGKGLPNFVVKWHYYVYKAEEMFLMNFMWIITLVVVVFFIYRLFKYFLKDRKISSIKVITTEHRGDFSFVFEINESEYNYAFPIVTSAIFYAFISFFYFTYLHYRYVQLNLLFMVLLLGYCVNYIYESKKFVGNFVLTIVASLFLVESYFTIDPITYRLFINFDAGNKNLVSTRRYFYDGFDYGYLEDSGDVIAKHLLHEGTDYNREILQLQYALEDVLDAIDYNSDKLIILDNFGGWLDNDCWQLFGASNSKIYYWDANSKTVNMDKNGELINLSVDPSSWSYKKYNEVYYLDFTFNKYQSDSYLEKRPILDEFTCSKGAWKIRVCKIWEKRFQD